MSTETAHRRRVPHHAGRGQLADAHPAGPTSPATFPAAAVASILGLLAGGVLYRWLSAQVFLLSALLTGLVCLLAFRIAGDEPASAD